MDSFIVFRRDSWEIPINTHYIRLRDDFQLVMGVYQLELLVAATSFPKVPGPDK